ncbi:NAD(P)-binding domain-containing protein [Thermoflavifilum sp.]|uniref:NAD(P)-binding domain-containing protein n=1 Tax=Thermoflavifilum sp. TaxID=1968839 RepID=UPI0025E4D7F1|nr:NAD(P)-binding domain-containing protein [Thermoflavifilum sp.]
MIIREDQISDRVKYWVKPDIENRIKNGEIKAYFQSHVVAIREEDIDVQTPQGLITLPNDFVLAMTGYLPNFGLLENLGVQIQDDEMRTPVYNEATMETNQPNVYLAGVVCGGLQTNKWFIENSRVHAVTIIQDLKRKKLALQPQSV